MNEFRKRIIDWARDHDFVINPSKGYEQYIQDMLHLGFCPCDTTRRHCPCPESVEEVKVAGHCLCSLYWKDLQTFKDTLQAGQGDDIVR